MSLASCFFKLNPVLGLPCCSAPAHLSSPSIAQGIGSVLSERDVSQILNPIVVSNTVDVIDYANRISPMHDLPDQSVHGIFAPTDMNCAVTHWSRIAGWCAWQPKEGIDKGGRVTLGLKDQRALCWIVIELAEYQMHRRQPAHPERPDFLHSAPLHP